jgi:hypothetical protein
MQTLQQLAHKQLDDVTFFRSMLDRLIEVAAAVGGVIYVLEDGTLRRVAMAGEIASRPDLDAAAARSCALDDDASETAFASDMEAASDRTDAVGVGIYTLDCAVGDERTIQGVLVLELTSSERSASLRSRLGGVGALMSERARMSASHGDPLRSRTTVARGQAATLPDDTTTTAQTK